MSKRATSLRFAEGTAKVGTATVHPDRAIAGYAQKKLAEKFGTPAASGFDEIAAGEAVKSLLAPPPRKVTDAPRVAAKKVLQALGRLKAGAMNVTERRYAEHLDMRRRAGAVAWFRFEGMKFRLAEGTFYTPDFAVMLASGELECHEVKGFWEDDARVKVKVVAEQYPLRFIAVTAKTKKAGGGWAIEEF